nr:hypothetical protein Iba_chr08cCG4680 [Ipomoea batatas]
MFRGWSLILQVTTGHLDRGHYRSSGPWSLQVIWTVVTTGHLDRGHYRSSGPWSLQVIWTVVTTGHLDRGHYRIIQSGHVIADGDERDAGRTRADEAKEGVGVVDSCGVDQIGHGLGKAAHGGDYHLSWNAAKDGRCGTVILEDPPDIIDTLLQTNVGRAMSRRIT